MRCEIAQVFLIHGDLVQGGDGAGGAAGSIVGGIFDSALGLLCNRLLVRDCHVHLDLQPVVALPQFITDLFGFVHRLLQPGCLGPQGTPRGELSQRRR